MSLADIRTELKTTLEAVSGIGLVYDYLRWKNEEKGLKALFKTANKKFHGWEITRRASSEQIEEQNYSNFREHTFVIFGVLGLSDKAATEKTFQDLIEAICAALRTAGKCPAPLSGKAWYVFPPQVDRVEHRMFAGVLVHSCEITLKVQEYITF